MRLITGALVRRLSTVSLSRVLLLAGLLGAEVSTVQAQYHHHHHGWSRGPVVSVYYAAPAPYYGPVYYPGYEAPYVYRRPNYAVTGTLLGALTGGLIGDSIHHQGWEGAGIGAAAGLVLGGLAEYSARRSEQRAAAAAPPVSYATPSAPVSAPAIPNAPTVPNAPTAPPAPTIPNNASPSSASVMSSANSLFGR